jgi:methionyl-tRNA formyltransferase
MAGLRLAFMGSPEFAVPALHALVAAGHEVATVYCQPPRPAGRGQATRACPVQQAAEALGIPVRTPAKLRRDEAEHAAFAALHLDVAVVAAYGLILPSAMLDAPRFGCLNIHASLLPRWRGAAPIQAAILAGDAEAGVTIMQMDAGLDTGAMRRRAAVALDHTSTAAWLHDQLAALGARLVVETLADLCLPAPPPAVPQPADGATYAPKLERGDGKLDWTAPATELDRRVRALNPWPGTFCRLADEVLKVHQATPVAGHGEPGLVLDDRLTIACGDGALRLLRVQRAGKAAQPADAFLRGHPVPPGSRLA